jgi:hypothetical protein
LAGDRAAAKRSQNALIASDLIEELKWWSTSLFHRKNHSLIAS